MTGRTGSVRMVTVWTRRPGKSTKTPPTLSRRFYKSVNALKNYLGMIFMYFVIKSWIVSAVCHQAAIEQGVIQQQLFAEFHVGDGQRVHVTQHA